MKIKNLLKEPVHIFGTDGTIRTINPEGIVPEVHTVKESLVTIEGIRVTTSKVNGVYNLPDKEEDTILIVPVTVAMARMDRDDLYIATEPEHELVVGGGLRYKEITRIEHNSTITTAFIAGMFRGTWMAGDGKAWSEMVDDHTVTIHCADHLNGSYETYRVDREDVYKIADMTNAGCHFMDTNAYKTFTKNVNKVEKEK